ncbi:MAG: bacillithiol biosynthesis cysteine-adding enzyme BshC [Planctomycetota bacterium]
MKCDSVDLPSRSYFSYQIARNHSAIFNFETLSLEQIKPFQEHSFLIRQDPVLNKLKTYLQSLGASPASLQNAERLRNPQSLVVCTGQQCGFFTGPLLTIYKTITAIQLAQKLEQQLNVPVIPLFWNPSEDHDFPEINHLYLPETLEKYTFSRPFSRSPVESISIDNSLLHWGEQFWKKLPQNEFTSLLQEQTLPALGSSVSAWFSSILLKLFAEEGLVVVEPYLFRQESAPVFLQAAQKLSVLEESLRINATEIQQQGFSPLLTIEKETPLFFLLDHFERIKGKKDSNGFHFNDTHFTSDQFEELLQSGKISASANVALRPILQNFLFPAFVYVAGPSEGSYWFEIFPLFSQFQCPPSLLYPRFSATLMEPKIQKKLEKLSISVLEVLQGKQPAPSESQEKMDLFFSQTQQAITQQFQNLQSFCVSIDPTLPVKKTEEQFQQSLETLKRKVDQRLQELHGQGQTQWKQIQNQLYPQETLQERKLNVFPFLNKYGPLWFKELKQTLTLKNGNRHHLISW